MDVSKTEVELQFSQPVRQIALMCIVSALVVFGGYLIYPTVRPVIIANPFLNTVIGIVFVVGVLTTFWQVLQLVSSVSWLERFAEGSDKEAAAPPRLLASLAPLLRSRGQRMQIGSNSARSILESAATRIDELRDITRYIVNLLVFLGLLGTFYGLATTVPAVVETIRSLAPQDGEGGVEVFGRLMGGLEAQLGGMGTAFGSSLLGLAGSLVVGLLELFANHGQNRFYRELEEWLSSITRLSFSGDSEGGPADQSVMTDILDHMAEQMDAMRRMFADNDMNRVALEDQMGAVGVAVQSLADQIAKERKGGSALNRIADGQEKLLAYFATKGDNEATGDDAETRMRLRSIDTQLLHILEEMAAGRQESIGEVRSDIAQLVKVIRHTSRMSKHEEP